jgi:hypothetical protein
MTLQQVGSNVVETGSGTINLSALTNAGVQRESSFAWPSLASGGLARA